MTPAPNSDHSSAWISFSYGSFLAALAMIVVGIAYLPVDIWMKGYLAMGLIMVIQTCVNLTKTLRDTHESRRLVNRIEDAKTEQLLMRIDPTKA